MMILSEISARILFTKTALLISNNTRNKLNQKKLNLHSKLDDLYFKELEIQ